MMLVQKNTVVHKLLDVARGMGLEPWTKEAFVVAVWKSAPDRWCLEGYPMYPDSNRVLTNFWGKKGLLATGYVERVGSGLFRVSGNGKEDLG